MLRFFRGEQLASSEREIELRGFVEGPGFDAAVTEGFGKLTGVAMRRIHDFGADELDEKQ